MFLITKTLILKIIQIHILQLVIVDKINSLIAAVNSLTMHI